MTPMTLDEARISIDAIDKELLRLLNERAHFVNVIGEIKQKQGLEIYAPEREEKLLRKLVELNKAQDGKLPERSIRAIYREIMSAALAIEHPLRIAYLGAPGAIAHQVALNKFGHGVAYVGHPTPALVFHTVSSLEADYAVVPNEQLVYGPLEMLADGALQVCAQITVTSSTQTPSRFFIVGRRASPATGDDSALILVESSDQVGALQALLKPFVEQGINVRHIEHRPAQANEPNRASFVLEVAGHPEEPTLKAALEGLAAASITPKVLGAYPATAWIESLA